MISRPFFCCLAACVLPLASPREREGKEKEKEKKKEEERKKELISVLSVGRSCERR
jgi:hypothetical protein